MKFPPISRFGRQLLAVACGVGAAFALGGCGNIFVPKQRVLVDAISAPGVTKPPAGQSYRLVAKKSVVVQTPVQVPVVAACLNAALVTKGMFEAPANAPSDIFIEVSFGVDSSPRADPSARESFLQLSARSNPDRSLDRSIGEELWDVRVSVLGLPGRLEPAMPLLCAVAAAHAGTNTHSEQSMQIPRNSPEVASVREAAIKTLDAKNAATSAGAAGPAPAAAATMTPVK